MKIVFSSFDWIEAQGVAAMLEGSGFKVAVWGADGARYGLPQFPESPGVRVAVPDDQFADALVLVEDYRKAKPVT